MTKGTRIFLAILAICFAISLAFVLTGASIRAALSH
jgi:hypothetical protein